MSPVREQLLAIMDQKHHWAYPALTRLTRDQLKVHFRHEYLVYVRDFPVLLARALGITPPLEDVRSMLAANLYEEQTGGLSQTQSHPSLFLRMMAGLGYDASAFADDAGTLQEAAKVYRAFLLERSSAGPWQAAVALLTIFVEGSVNERAELAGTSVRARGEAAVLAHPLVVHYGCPPGAMELTRAHAKVEGGHREDAWAMVLSHTQEDPIARSVVDTCAQALGLWRRYRDEVAAVMGLREAAV
jgi:pyrroloquinoline-quinone synthase